MKLIRFLVLAAIFATAATPFILTPGILYPFVTGKAIWFRVAVDLAVFGWLAMALEDERYRPRHTPTLGVFGAVLGVMAVADALAVDPAMAFFSNVERMDGWFALAHLFAFALVASSVMDTPALRRSYLYCLLATSAAVAGVGFWQYHLFILNGVAWAQIWSTLGNAVYLGQYAGLMLCVAAFLAPGAGKGGRAVLCGAALLNLTMLYLSQGRGATLALLAGGAAAAFSLSGRRTKLLASGAVCAVGLILIVMPFFVHGSREHLFNDIDLADPRLTIWWEALDAARQHPILGYGQENIRGALHNVIYADRAHNIFLDWLLAGGILGLYAWMWLLWSIRHEATMCYQGGERAAIMAFLTVYLVSNFFMFDTQVSELLLGTVMVLTISAWREGVVAVPARRKLYRSPERGWFFP